MADVMGGGIEVRAAAEMVEPVADGIILHRAEPQPLDRLTALRLCRYDGNDRKYFKLAE